MTPSFMGLIAVMLPGVRPSISLASVPTASMRPFVLFRATIDGSLRTMPFPRAYTQVFAVPKSIARSCENRESSAESMKAEGQHVCRQLHFRIGPKCLQPEVLRLE